MRRIALPLALVTAALAGALATAGAATAGVGSAATPPGVLPPNNFVAFANLGLTQMLTVGPTRAAMTEFAQPGGDYVFDLVYQTHLATDAGFSSPYLLKHRATGACLQDLGEGRVVMAATCETAPSTDSAQLWQHHRVPDRVVNGRDYYFRFHRGTPRVLTAFPTTPNPASARVVSLPAEPVSKSGAADPQLWVMLGQ
jgi:hypothetical protein